MTGLMQTASIGQFSEVQTINRHWKNSYRLNFLDALINSAVSQICSPTYLRLLNSELFFIAVIMLMWFIYC